MNEYIVDSNMVVRWRGFFVGKAKGGHASAVDEIINLHKQGTSEHLYSLYKASTKKF